MINMKRYQPMDLLQLTWAEYIPMGIFAYLTLNGRIDVDRLVKAVVKAAAYVPETLCSVSPRMRYRPCDPEAKTVVDEVQGPFETGFPLDPHQGTQLKIRVVHNEDSDSLIVGMSHVVTDGRGLIQYISLLAAAYDDEITLGRITQIRSRTKEKEFQASEREPLPLRNSRAFEPIMKGMKIGKPTQLEKIVKKMPAQIFPLQSTGTQWFCRDVAISKETMDSLHDKVRRDGVTLNDVFLAGSARVINRILDVPIPVMPCPTDLRVLVDLGPLSIGNLSGMYTMGIPVTPGEPISATVETVHREMTEMRSRNRCCAPAPLFLGICHIFTTGFIKMMVTSAFKASPVPYSNFGIVRPLSFGNVDVVSCFLTGTYNTYPGYRLTVSSYHGVTHFVATLIGDEERANAIEDIIRQIVDECVSY